MNRIVVLGSSGFLGKSLRQKLSEEKFDVKYMIHKKNTKLKENEFFGDILDEKSLLQNIQDGDIVVNLVGQIDNNFSKFFETNLKGSFNLLNTAKSKKNIKIIFASSINVYGESCKYPSKETDEPNPMTSYSVVKFLSEQLYQKHCKLYGLDVAVLRFSNIYGKNKKSGIITNIIKSKSNKPVHFTYNGNQQRDFLFIDDAIHGIIQVIKKQPKKFEIFNISSSNKIIPKKIVKLIECISNRKVSYTITKEKFDEKCIWADNTKAKKILRFTPKTTFQDGLKITLEN